ncbi:MAG: S1 RNA-binding domain-containing protein [Chloroflexota bacterium]|jgi:ribosomal protein S1
MENPAVAESNTKLEIKSKMQFAGKVIKTTLAGAVVEIGDGQRAVLHVSQIVTPNDQPIKSVREILHEGQVIDVWVRRVKDNRVELTMIKPLGLEWRDIKTDMVVKGKVVRIENFGVFLDIGAERPGLIHISELAHGYVRTPTDVVQEGDELEAQVIDVNKKKKQIKLSLKALTPEPVIEEVEEPPKDFKKDKPRRQKKGSARKSRGGEFNENLEALANLNNENQAAEIEPTAMEIALREAMERAKDRKREEKAKKAKSVSSEQEEILARTLDHKSSTQ